MQYDFRGKTVLVTGASGGIGRAVALRFAAAGADLILHANEDRKALEEIVDQVNVKAETIPADFSRSGFQEEFCEALRDRIDIWVNAAGLDLMSPTVRSLPYDEKLRRLFQVDVFAAVELSRRIGLRMKEQAGGTIVFFSWDGVDYGRQGDTAELYGAAKGALLGYGRSLAERLAPEVRVRCLALGWIRTRWGRTASGEFDRKVAEDTLAARWGTPEEVAQAVLFLSDESSAYVDGINLRLNGGKRGNRD